MSSERLVQEVVSALNEAGSNSTRTHVQKLLFFLEQWSGSTGYRFGLHLHGPYSSSLDRDIMVMEATGKLNREPGFGGYGSRYSTETVEPSDMVRDLANWLARKPTRALEALSTVELFDSPGKDDEVFASVKEVKPHLREDEIWEAIEEVREKRAALKGG
jgi:uncharacterized protein YwgA